MSQTPAFDLAPTPIARRLLELYQRDLGLAESPLGSNRGPQIEKYLRGYRNRYGDRYARGAKWCALACEYLARESYDTLGITPCPLDKWHGLGGASGWLRFAERDGALLVTMDPAPGDVAVIYDAVKDVGHVCVVALPPAGGEIVSMDGNHEDKMAWAERPVSAFAGFVRLPWEPGPTAPRPPVAQGT